MRETSGERPEIDEPDLPRHLGAGAVLAAAQRVLQVRSGHCHDGDGEEI